MVERPTGTVTFLFTDIEGSTKLWEQHHDSMERAHKRQEAILRDYVTRHNGYTYKMIGDAFQVAFATATEAISAAIDAQRALHTEDWGELGAIRVRMALHTGVTEERGDDYVGPVLNRVARLMSAGHGGQVLLTQATFDLVRDRLPKNITFRDLGEHRLKDLVRPERVYQIFAPDLPSDFPLLKTLDTQTVSGEPPAPGDPPFKGLHYFDEADADIFFGRELLTAKLVAHLRNSPSPASAGEGRGEGRLLVVIGASGSGKSSLVRAGLIPALKREEPLEDGTVPPQGSAHWYYHVITPTAHPLESLAVSLTRDSTSVVATTTLMDDLARDARSLHLYVRKQSSNDLDRYLLVVDQFEELFTLCRDEAERRAFIDNLLTTTSPKFSGPTIVVITLRADFYAHCAHYADLREVVAKHQEYIGPMNQEELRRAIQGPAQHGKWEFEAGLLDLILHDVGDEPGTLPLLSHALLETWERRRGRRLTLKGYDECGGVRGAIAETAESVYQNLVPEQQAIARNIFLRLTALGEGTQDTRRRATLSELIPPFVDAQAADAVLKMLADARLVTTSEGYAEVAHEALIREWPTLREWLNQNREGLRLHRHLTEAAQEWEQLKRDPGALYRGARLAQAIEWAGSHADELNALEREFLDASKQAREREEAEREAQRQRELVAAQRLAETQTRAAEQLRKRAVFLVGALLVALVLAFAAIWFAQQSSQNEQAAISQKGIAESERLKADDARLKAEDERRIAFTRELSRAATNNLDIDPERSILLALQAISVSSAGGKPLQLEAEEALHQSVTSSHLQLSLVGHTDRVRAVAFSPNGTRLATASKDGTAKVWDAATGKELLTLTGHNDRLLGIAYSPDGTRLATASRDRTAKIWDTATGKELHTLSGPSGFVIGVAFSPDGTRLATGNYNGMARVWDVASGKELFTLIGGTDPVSAPSFRPDGMRLATVDDHGRVKVWDLSSRQPLVTLNVAPSIQRGLPVPDQPSSLSPFFLTDPDFTVTYSPDGTRLATTYSGDARILDASNGKELLSLTGHANNVNYITFSLDGKRVATGSLDSKAKAWDAVSGKELLSLSGHRGSVNGVAFNPDGTRIATGSDDNTAKIWDLSPGHEVFVVSGHLSVRNVAFSPDSKRFATVGTGSDVRDESTAKVWDATTGALLFTLRGHTRGVTNVIFNHDGTRLATSSSDKTVKVWDLQTGKELFTLSGHTDDVYGLKFSPDGKKIATGSRDQTAKVWDAATGKELISLPSYADEIASVAFSPDGTRLATATQGQDNVARVWDISTGQTVLTLKGHASILWAVTYSFDGKRIATASGDGTAKVWDAETGKELLTLTGHTSVVADVAFTPDEKRIATSSTDATVKLWDANSGKELITLTGHTDQVFGIAISPDGRRLATAGNDGTSRVYALPLEDILAIAKSRVTRALTTDECQKFLHVEQCP